MILILGETYDSATDVVCAYLNYYKAKYVRINEDTRNVVEYLTIDNNQGVNIIIHDFDGTEHNLKDFRAIWNRRGSFLTQIPAVNQLKFKKEIKNKIQSHLKTEVEDMLFFIYDYFKEKKSINNPLNYNVNKLTVLNAAQKNGLKIPQTVVTKNKKSLLKYAGESLITKNIANGHIYSKEGLHIMQGTQEVDVEKLNNQFYYSLFQNQIQKKLELRIFVLGKEMHCAAIFSQQNDKTKIDYRNYDHEMENNIAPYLLPKEVKSKILKLMNEIGLNSGSIDVIVTPENEYVFLEVNPVGQFQWIGAACNFNLEKKIAKYLIEE